MNKRSGKDECGTKITKLSYVGNNKPKVNAIDQTDYYGRFFYNFMPSKHIETDPF